MLYKCVTTELIVNRRQNLTLKKQELKDEKKPASTTTQ